MKIAVIGAGIAGLASAWRLSQRHDVTLFEAADRLGGHTDTHDVEVGGRRFAVDTGFIVFNPVNYPLLSAMFDELGVASRPTPMSFSVHAEADGLEYNAGTLDGLFCQRRNLASPRFLGMVRDLLRFYREAPALLHGDDDPTLDEYLTRHRYGAMFRDRHLVPMASALWSAPAHAIGGFPMRYLVQFMAHHRMLQVAGRPEWRVVAGGSSTYIRALQARWSVRERLSCAVQSVRRDAEGVEVRSAGGVERFDHAVLACHGDDALALLADADADERAVLGAFAFRDNEVVLHTDATLLPRHRKAWAAWNAHVPRDAAAPCSVSYCMNLLQGLDAPEALVVTLNRTDAIDPARVLRTRNYRHPEYTRASVAARGRKQDIQGRRRTWFAGAYWGWGFHEDGMRSAMDAVAGIDAHIEASRVDAGREALPA